MRTKTLLSLAVAVFGLAAFIWLFERQLPSSDERRERERRLMSFAREDVLAIVIKGADTSLRLEKLNTAEGNDEWNLVSPLTARADADKVSSFLDALSDLEKKRTIDEPVLSDLGLDDPRWRLQLTAAGEDWHVLVGHDIPASSDVIVAIEGRGVFVSAGAFVQDLEEGAGEWRSRDVIPGGKDAVTGIRARRADGELRLARRDGLFYLESPLQDEADESEIASLLRALDELTVEEFLDDPVSDEEFGLATPEYAIELDLEGRSAPFTLTVGSTTGSSTRRYYAVEDSRFTVDSDLPNLLDRPAVEWQSRRWARLESFQTDAAEIALGDLEGRLERSDGEWRWNNEPVSYSAAADFLDTVTDVTGVRIVPRSDVDVEIDRRPILTLALSAAERVENLTIWSNEGGALLAGREGRDYVLEIEREQLELMRAAVMVLQDSSGDEGASEESLPLE